MSSILAQIQTDAAAIMADPTGYGESVQINGVATRVIVLEGFEVSDGDPRLPRLAVLESDLAAVTRPGAVVTFAGNSYAIQGYQPNGHGLAELVLGVPR